MGTYIDSDGETKELNDKIRDAFYSDTARVVGECEGTRESKFSGWKVLFIDGEMYACVVCPDGSYSCAERIEPLELHLYVDEPPAASARLDTFKAERVADAFKPLAEAATRLSRNEPDADVKADAIRLRNRAVMG